MDITSIQEGLSNTFEPLDGDLLISFGIPEVAVMQFKSFYEKETKASSYCAWEGASRSDLHGKSV
jgi:hypothetical protein